MVITLWKVVTVQDIMTSRVEKFQKPRKNYGRKKVTRLGPKSRSAVFQKRLARECQKGVYENIKRDQSSKNIQKIGKVLLIQKKRAPRWRRRG